MAFMLNWRCDKLIPEVFFFWCGKVQLRLPYTKIYATISEENLSLPDRSDPMAESHAFSQLYNCRRYLNGVDPSPMLADMNQRLGAGRCSAMVNQVDVEQSTFCVHNSAPLYFTKNRWMCWVFMGCIQKLSTTTHKLNGTILVRLPRSGDQDHSTRSRNRRISCTIIRIESTQRWKKKVQ